MARPSTVVAPIVLTLVIGLLPAQAAESVPEVLRRQTQELLDAIATGTAAVWDRYLDENLRYVDESGTVLKKQQMVGDLKPLPAGVSGTIKILDYDVAVHGDVAVATHLDDENEDFHGHALHCQYRITDTWLRTPNGWRLISGQVLPLRTDPPSVPLAAELRNEYCGRYELAAGTTYEIRCKGDSLEGQQTGRKVESLRAELPDLLFVPGRYRYRKVFLRGPDGRITGFAERREAWDIVWRRLP